MIFINVVLLTMLPLFMGATGKYITGSSLDKNKSSNICNGDDLKDVQKRLDEQQGAIKNLAQKIDSLNVVINQQNAIQQSELRSDLDDIKTTLKTVLSQTTSENQAQNELKNKLEDMQSIWKDELIEIKSTLKSLESRIIPDKIQQNELKNNLKEIELPLKTEVSQIVSDKFDNFTNNGRQIDQSVSDTTIKQSLPANCDEALQKGGESGVYKIKILNSDLEPFDVYCLTHVADDEITSSKNFTAWMIVQRREDGSVDFNRNWTEYQEGFGNLKGEFFIGLDKLYALTQSTSPELWIKMETKKGTKLWAKYDKFAIAGASDAYALNVLGAYTGNHGDALIANKGMKWSTKDVDNDTNKGNCASSYSGAWWYGSCSDSKLNGKYSNPSHFDWFSGSAWHDLKYSHMAIKPYH